MFLFDEIQLKKLRSNEENKIQSYPTGVDDLNDLEEVLSYNELSSLELETLAPFKVAGRLRFKNEMGNIGFGRIESNQKIQICVQKKSVSKQDFLTWKSLDIGDWVIGCGNLFRTRAGELTLNLNSISLYSKCLQGMPDKFSGLVDPELRQRMRYLDLIVNEESRLRFKERFIIIQKIRQYFLSQDYLEVDTPILQPIPGGANAKPFITHHNALDSDLYLRIAPELSLKKLLVGGFDKIFEIGKNFRNEGISTRHNPEFSVIEFYQAHATYQTLMPMVKDLICGLVKEKNASLTINYQGNLIDFNNWKVLSFQEAFCEHNIDCWSQESMKNFLIEKGFLELNDCSIEHLQGLIFDNFIEPNLINPTFITNHPVHFNPLARANDLDSRVTDNFELFINGLEIGPGFTELNDPVEQARRFQLQIEKRNLGDQEAMQFDDDFIKALSYGMVPAAGCGIGLDRLIMLITDSPCIRDIILFPAKKNKGIV